MADGFCPRTLQFCAVRLALLDGSGVPDPGAANLYVSKQVVLMTVAPNLEKGVDLTQKTGCDEIDFAYKGQDQLKEWTMGITFTTPDPDLVYLLAGGAKITKAGKTIGYGSPAIGTIGNSNGVCLEGWTKNIKGNTLDGTYPYLRWVFPKTTWVHGEKRFDNTPITHPFTGEGFENPNIYDGPANDFPDVNESYRSMTYFADTSLPTTQCQAVALAAS